MLRILEVSSFPSLSRRWLSLISAVFSIHSHFSSLSSLAVSFKGEKATYYMVKSQGRWGHTLVIASEHRSRRRRMGGGYHKWLNVNILRHVRCTWAAGVVGQEKTGEKRTSKTDATIEKISSAVEFFIPVN